MTSMICNFGCGKEATHQFKNGKWCCSKSQNSCDGVRKKIGLSNKLVNRSSMSDETKNKISNSLKGKKHKNKRIGIIPWNKGKKNIYSEETLNKMKESRRTEEYLKNLKTKMKNLWKDPNSKFNSKERSEKLRTWMKNGHAIYMIKCIKKISKNELKLKNIIKDLYHTSEPQYPVLNYAIDIAIPEFKIAIEYDGYYHFDTEEHKQYHIFRQKRIEKEGWKFIRYSYFNEFPNKEKVKTDILEKINGW